MVQHIIAFSLYTFAMIGIFFIAFIVYKKTMNINGSKLNNGMKIEDMLRLSQRKTIYIINVQGERFLIASDLENTTFLAKLDSNNILSQQTGKQAKNNLKQQIFDKCENMPCDENMEISGLPNNSKQIERYIKELETLDTAMGVVENHKDEHSNTVDLKSKNTIMKNILRELENNSKRTSI